MGFRVMGGERERESDRWLGSSYSATEVFREGVSRRWCHRTPRSKFFSDAGSNLELPANKVGDDLVFDYAKVADVLSHYKETESPLQAGAVVYNMLLQKVDPAEQKIAEDLDKAGKWGGEMLLNPTGANWNLCNGDEKTCPTPKLNVARSRHDELVAMGDAALTAFKDMLAAGSSELPPEIASFKARLDDVPEHYRQYVADGVPDSAWEHNCDGILKKGTGKDIFWVACSGFVASKASLEAIGLAEGLPSQITAPTAGPGHQESGSLTPKCSKNQRPEPAEGQRHPGRPIDRHRGRRQRGAHWRGARSQPHRLCQGSGRCLPGDPDRHQGWGVQQGWR